MGGAFLFWGYPVKPPLSWDEQVDLLVSRGLIVADQTECARAIADEHGAYGRYLDKDFYTEIEDREPTVISCLRDIDRSKDRHILRNRCAHHSRLWHHSVLDAGPTPNNVRNKAKRKFGQFESRSVLDVIASLDDMACRTKVADPLLPELFADYGRNSAFWQGLAKAQSPRDHTYGEL